MKQVKAAHEVGSRLAESQGRSILLVDIDAADIFEAVPEFFNGEHESEWAVEGEDVWPQASWIIGEVNESEEFSCSVGALLGVVGDVSEVALNGAFVRLYHIELI